MATTFEQQPNGDYWEIRTGPDGQERARFYRAARRLRRDGDRFLVVDHTGAETPYTGTVEGIAVVNGIGAVPAPALKLELERAMEADYREWIRWRDTRQEAEARALGAAPIAALQAKENAAWASYVQAIQRWRQL